LIANFSASEVALAVIGAEFCRKPNDNIVLVGVVAPSRKSFDETCIG
jgi:hypothetical protein